MMVIETSHVAGALQQGIALLAEEGVWGDSRAGRVLVAPFPVATVYTNPWMCTLVGRIRDANPFFHLAEAMWMLAGRNDAAFLNLFVRDFGERFAEPHSNHIHGAYGERWRIAFGYDQLAEVIERLRTNPSDRQCVIQMWDASRWVDGRLDLTGEWKDRPCNTHVYLRVVGNLLDLTVCCRSNDIVWGAYGANAVHFYYLQQYLADALGLAVGTLYQFSNNYHAYEDMLETMKRRAMVTELKDLARELGRGPPMPGTSCEDSRLFGSDGVDRATFDRELAGVLELVETMYDRPSTAETEWVIRSRFLREVFVPAMIAHHRFTREGNWGGAMDVARRINHYGWQTACADWLQRRPKGANQ
jgi:hypothetical protein